MTNTTDELAAFLRTRRERLSPDDVALPDRGRPRRTPGLRREEVAELAGVSVDYVVRLEQGRGLRPSPEVLEALAGALRLSEDERRYLFDLARQRPLRRSTPKSPAHLAQLVAALSPMPAMLLNHRFDIVAWNPEMCGLMVDFATVPEAERNALWLCLRHPSLRDFYVDRERIIREGIADLRAAWATRPDDSAFADLVAELTANSPEFARLWPERDVEVRGRGQKRLRHPTAGPVTVEFEVLTPLEDPEQRLVIYRAADRASQLALDEIARSVAPLPV